MADYVITKKRRRDAIDPCLGYYMRSQTPRHSNGAHPQSVLPAEERTPRLHYAAIPSNAGSELPDLSYVDTASEVDCTKRIYDVFPVTLDPSEGFYPHATKAKRTGTVTHQNSLTVETFLRRAAKTQTYASKTRRTKRLNAPTAHELSPDSDKPVRHTYRVPRVVSEDEDETDFGKSSPPRSKRRKRTKRCKPWKDRIYEAAVSIHCIPDDCFIRDGVGSKDTARAPLHFVPCPSASPRYSIRARPSPQATTPINHDLWSKRPRTLMRTSTFSNRHQKFVDADVLVNSLDRLPLSKWSIDLEKGDQSDLAHAEPRTTKRPNKKQATGAAVTGKSSRDVAYAPLTFVSLDEAEAKYKVMFADHGLRKNEGPKQADPGLHLLPVGDKCTAKQAFEVESTLSADPRGDRLPERHEVKSQCAPCISQSSFAFSIRDEESLSASSTVNHSSTTQILRSLRRAGPAAHKAEEGNESPSLSREMLPEMGTAPRNERQNPHQQIVHRPLKPLGSLTDMIRATMHNVSRPQESGPSDFLPHRDE